MGNDSNKYTSYELMEIFNIKKGSWYNLKNKFNLDLYAEKIIDNNKTKYLYNEQAYEILKNNCFKSYNSNNNNDGQINEVAIYQNQIIEMYKQENEYLKQENKRLLDIISVKEQKELAKDIKYIGNSDTMSFWDKLFNKFKKQ